MSPKVTHLIYYWSMLTCRIVLVNWLWYVMVILGAGVFGVVPATVTIVETFYHFNRNGDTFSWLKYAWSLYWYNVKKFFITSFCFSASLLILNIVRTFYAIHIPVIEWLFIVVIIYLVLVFLPYLAVNEAMFEVSRTALITNSLLLPLMWPLTTLRIIAVEAGVALLCSLISGLILFVAISLPLFLITDGISVHWQRQLNKLNRENEAGGEPFD